MLRFYKKKFFVVIAVGEFYGGFVGSVYLTDFLCVCVWLLLEYCTIRYVVLKFFVVSWLDYFGVCWVT